MPDKKFNDFVKLSRIKNTSDFYRLRSIANYEYFLGLFREIPLKKLDCLEPNNLPDYILLFCIINNRLKDYFDFRAVIFMLKF